MEVVFDSKTLSMSHIFIETYSYDGWNNVMSRFSLKHIMTAFIFLKFNRDSKSHV